MSGKRNSKPSAKRAAQPRGFFIFFGLCIFAITGGILWFNGRVSTLDCRRVESTQIDCAIETRWLGWLPLEQQTVQHLQSASVNQGCSENRKNPQSLETCVYGVELTTAGGVVALSPTLASGGNEEEKYALVAQINTFISDPSMPALHTAQSELGPQTFVLGGLALIGLAVAATQTTRLLTTRRGGTPGVKPAA
ncbi:MAG: hypothetical protein KDF65_05820 [Anaerolineae bacterium]|nr:hypothetical protein [Anaerolineae bacterium]